MKQAFEEVLGANIAKEVKIDTVDSFQGKQMDVIIMSCVRASGGEHSSFSNGRALLGVWRALCMIVSVQILCSHFVHVVQDASTQLICMQGLWRTCGA
jgi:AAA domain